MSGKYLGNKDIAEELGVPEKTVVAWRYRGIGPRGFKVGKHVRYRREDVDAWVAAHYSDDAA